MGKSFMIDHGNVDNYHALDGIPAMTSPQVHQYLEELGQSWTGIGCAMELGSWLGASSVALLKGLNKAGYDKPYWAFDLWIANPDQIPKAAAQGVRLKMRQDTRPLFLNNVLEVYKNVQAWKGGLPGTLANYDKDLIEFCIFDAPKTEPIFSMCIERLRQYWVPGVTVLGLLDYHFYLRHNGKKRTRFRAPVDFMEKWGHCFKVEKKWDDECVVFFRFMKNF